MRRLGHDCVALHYGTVLMAITTIDYEVTKERLGQNMLGKPYPQRNWTHPDPKPSAFQTTLTKNAQSDPVS